MIVLSPECFPCFLRQADLAARGIDEALLRQTAERIAQAKSVSMIEDLGVQMNVHSTLNSYLQRLIWLLTGHFGREGTNNAFVPFLSLASLSKGEGAATPELLSISGIHGGHYEAAWALRPTSGRGMPRTGGAAKPGPPGRSPGMLARSGGKE